MIYWDREKNNADEFVKANITTIKPHEPQFKESKFIKVEEGDLKSTMDKQDIKITVETDGKKMVVDIPYDADIFAWETKLNIILRWLTFQQDTIDLILGSKNYTKKCTCK